MKALRIKWLTSNKNEPNVKQNTSGPAKSVSCKIVWSVVRNGFKTDSVCKKIKKINPINKWHIRLHLLRSNGLTFCRIWFGLMPSSMESNKRKWNEKTTHVNDIKSQIRTQNIYLLRVVVQFVRCLCHKWDLGQHKRLDHSMNQSTLYWHRHRHLDQHLELFRMFENSWKYIIIFHSI